MAAVAWAVRAPWGETGAIPGGRPLHGGEQGGSEGPARECTGRVVARPASGEGGEAAPRELLDALDEALVMLDAAGRVGGLNAAARALLPGVSPGSALRDAPVPELREAQAAGRARFDGLYRGRRLTGRWVGLPSGRSAWVVRDVTRERAREDELLEERRRKALLARTGRALSGTLHLRRALSLAARLSVDTLADGAAVTLLCQPGLAETAVCGGEDVVFRTGPPAGAGTVRVLGTGRLERHEGVTARQGADLCAPGLAPPESGSVLFVPLLARGACLGVLTLVRACPYGDAELELVREHAERIAAVLDTASLYRLQSVAGERLRAALRPAPLPEVPGTRLGVAYRTSGRGALIGGDFCQVLHSASEGWLFAIGDVCGEGIGAAVYSARVRHALETVAVAGGPLEEGLALLNRTLAASGEARFVSLVAGRLRVRGDGSVGVALIGGGAPDPVVVREGGGVERVALGGTVVGALPEIGFGRAGVELAPGDALYVCTDGVHEARDPQGRRFGTARLLEALGTCAGAPPGAVVQRVEQLVVEHLDDREHDDLALFGAQAWPAGHRMRGTR
ncbi:SpoIIE family protein phosphatase [Actinomadura parmotrematis]|uniref:SpoIIE family protein phosphatase n=1 Tax=Actinomadura parmotrematis TaxID=2864039 RepID=A0ABS7FQQ6_9ACTN|nr:SpoIIE family protein phosphatase [Actinomadura parmotrematis]MBW8482735.1 SpoIIE family protein phosphatase [Actinomadura parmotrematis]